MKKLAILALTGLLALGTVSCEASEPTTPAPMPTASAPLATTTALPPVEPASAPGRASMDAPTEAPTASPIPEDSAASTPASKPTAAPTVTPTPGPSPSPAPTPLPVQATPVPVSPPTATPVPQGPEPTGLSALDWVRDGLTGVEQAAFRYIQQIEVKHPPVYEAVLGLHWLTDGITPGEAEYLCALLVEATPIALALVSTGQSPSGTDLPHCQQQPSTTVASPPTSTPTPRPQGMSMSDLDWIKDGLTEHEGYAAEGLRHAEANFPDIAQSALELEWVSDGLQGDQEWRFLYSLGGISTENAPLFRSFLALSWIADGITPSENNGFSNVRNTDWYDPMLAEYVMGLPWFQDGLTGWESYNIGIFERAAKRIATADPYDIGAARRVLGFPWLTDGITWQESAALQVLIQLPHYGPELTGSILNSTLATPPIQGLRFAAINGMLGLVKAGLWEQVTEQEWFRDGLDDDDYILIKAVSDLHRDQTDLNDILRSIHYRSETISLPLRGEVKLFAIVYKYPEKLAPAFESHRHAVLEYEKFLQVPLPQTFFGIFVADQFSANYRGLYTRMSTVMHSTVYHEAAHAYFAEKPHPGWVAEGLAEFLSRWLRYQGDLPPSLAGANRGCPALGIRTVQESIDFRAAEFAAGRGVRPNADCAYTTGETFFLEMYLALGRDVVSSYMRELYKAGERTRDEETGSYSWLSEDEVFRIMFTHTPTEKQDRFLELYRQFHGGPIPDL